MAQALVRGPSRPHFLFFNMLKLRQSHGRSNRMLQPWMSDCERDDADAVQGLRGAAMREAH